MSISSLKILTYFVQVKVEKLCDDLSQTYQALCDYGIGQWGYKQEVDKISKKES